VESVPGRTRFEVRLPAPAGTLAHR
jgi:hypothetical protein